MLFCCDEDELITTGRCCPLERDANCFVDDVGRTWGLGDLGSLLPSRICHGSVIRWMVAAVEID
ncbi:hypothetical protein ACLOJK_018828 [Asimina triloba]